tara:strand:- start:153 stop:680 length:528 start_codon:yes stop_codon:yes gene_type:complete
MTNISYIPNLFISVAYDSKNGIGKNNSIPWYLPEDLKYFSKLTKGNGNNAIIMGKNTWLSLPKKPLKGRDNLILSKTLEINENSPKNNLIKTFKYLNSIMEFSKEQNYDEVWIIGGSEIYNLFLNKLKVKRIYATLIDKDYECDTFFPLINNWTIVNKESTIKDNIKITYFTFEN